MSTLDRICGFSFRPLAVQRIFPRTPFLLSSDIPKPREIARTREREIGRESDTMEELILQVVLLLPTPPLLCLSCGGSGGGGVGADNSNDILYIVLHTTTEPERNCDVRIGGRTVWLTSSAFRANPPHSIGLIYWAHLKAGGGGLSEQEKDHHESVVLCTRSVAVGLIQLLYDQVRQMPLTPPSPARLSFIIIIIIIIISGFSAFFAVSK